MLHADTSAATAENPDGFRPGGTMEEWMAEDGLDDAAVGELIGKDRTTVYRNRTGKANYNFIEAVVIASNGRVDPGSFFRRAIHKAALASRGGGAPRPFNSTSPASPAEEQDQATSEPAHPHWLLPRQGPRATRSTKSALRK